MTTTSIYDGTDTAVVVDKTTELLGGISYVEIVDGGTGFFIYDSSAGAWTPQTFNTDVFDSTGTGGQSITETQLYPPNDGGGVDADIRVDSVVGDVEYIQIVSQALSGTGDGTYDFDVWGDTPNSNRSEWRITVVSDVITQVERVTAGSGYTFTNDITSISGVTGTFTLRPYIVGLIGDFSVVSAGSGYTSTTYNLTEATRAGFTVTGEGTTNLGTLDVVFNNPINEKLKLSHYGDGTLTGNVGASPFTVTTGNIINSITFDEWGHITNIGEAGTPFGVWNEIDETDSPFTTTQNYSYFVDTSTAAVEVRLAVGPSLGDTVMLDDVQENSSINNITVNDSAGANLLVAGDSSTPTVIDMDGVRIILIYVNATYGWRLKTI